MARQLLLTAACVVGMAGAGAAAAFAALLTDSGPAPSRAAADRACDAGAPAEAPARLAGAPLSLRTVGRADEPSSLALEPDGDGDGVLGERAGRLIRVERGTITGRTVLDLSDDTTDEGDGGLLGLAYDPDGGWLYVYRATEARDDVVTAYPLDERGLPQADAERLVLAVDHPPSEQHHGGSLLFGPDGMLYIGLGDGGGLGDPRENAQDPSTLLGKVLRIDPTPWGPTPYLVPADNPFAGTYGWRPEIWVLGVRNPFRMGLDEATGDLWLGDVGQSCWEELDRLPTGTHGAGGSNLGWDRTEGPAPFEGGDVRGGELKPVHTHPHAGGWCAVVVGYVVRDESIPQLDGWLLHTDYCAGQLLALRADSSAGEHPAVADLGVEVDRPVAIVPGPAGRPWVLSLGGSVYELDAG